MNTRIRIVLAVATLGLASVGHAENGAELFKGIIAQTNHTLIPIFEWRARYEFGEQDGLDAAHAATLRGRVGLQSQDYNGFTGLVEFEATRAIDTTSYYVPNVQGDPSKTVIADPESTEINRFQLQFMRNDNLLIGGRQRIILDNARYIGNVGWRQNEQTFDAFSYKNTMVDELSLYYAYLDRVNRIFGSEAPKGTAQDDFKSDSHLINASYSGFEGHKITGYAYLLDFDNSAANSSDTVGLNYAYKGTVSDDYTFNGYAELAYQQDSGDNPIDYKAPYFHLNGKLGREGYTAQIGYELLGSDDGKFGFRTPLATGHKFNGWNDQFLVTPRTGLQDFYVAVGFPVPKVPVTFVYHYFHSDSGSFEYGQEIDAVAAHKISQNLKAIAKFSYYVSANETPVGAGAPGQVAALNSDRTRFSVELNYKY